MTRIISKALRIIELSWYVIDTNRERITSYVCAHIKMYHLIVVVGSEKYIQYLG